MIDSKEKNKFDLEKKKKNLSGCNNKSLIHNWFRIISNGEILSILSFKQ